MLFVLERATQSRAQTTYSAFRGFGGERSWSAHPFRSALLPPLDPARTDHWLWLCAIRAEGVGPFLRFERARDEIDRWLE